MTSKTNRMTQTGNAQAGGNGLPAATPYDHPASRWDQWRDNTACRLCNMILRHLATPYYRRMIEGSIRLGFATAMNPDAYALATGRPAEPSDGERRTS